MHENLIYACIVTALLKARASCVNKNQVTAFCSCYRVPEDLEKLLIAANEENPYILASIILEYKPKP